MMELRKSRSSRHPFHYFTQAFNMALVGLVVISFVMVFNQFKLSHYFPIKTVKVYGIHRGYQQEVQDLLMPLVSKGFFTINVEYIRERLLQMPWVANLYVRRLWPDQIDITIVEKNPIALWSDGSLLSETGELFVPNKASYPTALPQLMGPDGQQLTLLENFNQINRLLLPLHAKISYLQLTPYLTWTLKLDNGITLQLGHKDILTRLDHFVKVYPKIIGDKAMEVDYIDLRYPNGVAVRWKSSKTD